MFVIFSLTFDLLSPGVNGPLMWIDLYLNVTLCSDRTKPNAKKNNFFDVSRLFFDFLWKSIWKSSHFSGVNRPLRTSLSAQPRVDRLRCDGSLLVLELGVEELVRGGLPVEPVQLLVVPWQQPWRRVTRDASVLTWPAGYGSVVVVVVFLLVERGAWCRAPVDVVQGSRGQGGVRGEVRAAPGRRREHALLPRVHIIRAPTPQPRGGGRCGGAGWGRIHRLRPDPSRLGWTPLIRDGWWRNTSSSSFWWGMVADGARIVRSVRRFWFSLLPDRTSLL